MSYYSIRTLVVSLPIDRSAPVIIKLPDNAIPLGVEICPVSTPEGLLLHHLVLCDEDGNPIEEVFTPDICEMAWNELYKLYGEHLDQDNLDVMDAVLKGVKGEIEGESIKHGIEETPE